MTPPAQIVASFQGQPDTTQLTYPLPSLPDSSLPPGSEAHSDFLFSVYTAVGKMQDDINVFLTQQMEQNSAETVDTTAEDNYGEEGADSEE